MNTPTRPEKNGPGHGAHERSATELLPLERQLTECIVVPQGVSLGSARPKMTRRQVDKTWEGALTATRQLSQKPKRSSQLTANDKK